MPRASYPDGRIAYLTWRKDLQKLHARRAGEIMAQCGYSEVEIARTQSLLKKEPVLISGFGKFSVVQRAPRQCVVAPVTYPAIRRSRA